MTGTQVATTEPWALKRVGQDRAEHYERASRSEQTWRQYKSAWNAWERWCALNGWTARPRPLQARDPAAPPAPHEVD
jgi:hypothetical protein